MNEYRFVLPLFIFLSPLLYILSGCQWKPDATGEVIHVKTSDFLTPKVTTVSLPAKTKSPDCDCVDCKCDPCLCKPVTKPVKFDPLRVPTEDDPYAPPPRVVLPKSNPPLVNAEQLQQGNCANGMCFEPQGDEQYSNEGRRERRGPIRRWLGR